MTTLLILFLIAHGLVHLAIWAAPKQKNAPFDPTHSWLIGNHKIPALALALIATVLLVAGGLALWADASWWKAATAAGLLTSFLLMVVYFHLWFIPIQLVNVGLLFWLVWPALIRL